MKIVDTAFNGAVNRNKPMDLSELANIDLSRLSDCYSTYFIYGQDFKDYILKTGSVKGFKGSYGADFLPFDIDNDDLQKAKDDAISLIMRLQMAYNLNNADTEIYFTGAKGFHIQIPQEVFGKFDKSDLLAKTFKILALELSSGINIDTTIYDSVRLWRIPNTINSKTGLYKISLSITELFNLTILEIKELAKSTRIIIPSDPVLNERMSYLYTQAKIEKKPINISGKIRTYAKHEKYCIYSILNTPIPDGERNNALLRLAVYFKSRFNKSNLSALLSDWNEHYARLPKNEVDRTISSSLNEYDFGCNDGLLMKYCSKECSYHLKKIDIQSNIKSIIDMENCYKEYIKHIDDLKIDLSKWLPKFNKVSRGITAGEVVITIAGSGVGKTAFLQNLLWNITLPAIFFSYELPEILTFERFYQIVNGCSGENVENDYKNNIGKSNEIKYKFKDTYFNFDSSTKIDDIPKIVSLVEEKNNIKIKMVAIDYLGLVKGGNGSRYERVSYIAEALKDIAKKTNSVVICLAQVSRQQGALGNEDLTLISGKDSGSIENTGDLVLGMSRPFKDDFQKDNVIRISILKNRKGRDGQYIDCHFNKENLRIMELHE